MNLRQNQQNERNRIEEFHLAVSRRRFTIVEGIKGCLETRRVESLHVVYLCALSVSGISLIVAMDNPLAIRGNYHVVQPHNVLLRCFPNICSSGSMCSVAEAQK